MLRRYAVLLIAVVFTSLLSGCGSEPKTAPKTEPTKTQRQKTEPGYVKENSEQPKGSAASAKGPVPKKPKRAPEPPWLLTLPAGAKLDAFLRPEGENRFFLGRAGRFSGLYERRGDRLVMEKPQDAAETGFEWEARGPDEFALVAQRPNTGSNYLGALLKRVKDDEAKKPTSP